MRKRKWTDRELAAYYDTHSCVPDMLEAERNGTLVISRPGENLIEAIARHNAAMKKTAVTMRLPVGVVNKAKEQAADAGIPWTSYVRSILEHAVMSPRTKGGYSSAVALR